MHIQCNCSNCAKFIFTLLLFGLDCWLVRFWIELIVKLGFVVGIWLLCKNLFVLFGHQPLIISEFIMKIIWFHDLQSLFFRKLIGSLASQKNMFSFLHDLPRSSDRIFYFRCTRNTSCVPCFTIHDTSIQFICTFSRQYGSFACIEHLRILQQSNSCLHSIQGSTFGFQDISSRLSSLQQFFFQNSFKLYTHCLFFDGPRSSMDNNCVPSTLHQIQNILDLMTYLREFIIYKINYHQTSSIKFFTSSDLIFQSIKYLIWASLSAYLQNCFLNTKPFYHRQSLFLKCFESFPNHLDFIIRPCAGGGPFLQSFNHSLFRTTQINNEGSIHFLAHFLIPFLQVLNISWKPINQKLIKLI